MPPNAHTAAPYDFRRREVKWLEDVVIAGNVFARAGVHLSSEQRAAITALVTQASEIAAHDEERVRNRELPFVLLAVLVSALAIPIGLTVRWDLSTDWVLAFIIAESVAFFLMVGLLDLLDRLGGRKLVNFALAAVVWISVAAVVVVVYAFTISFPGGLAAFGFGMAAGLAGTLTAFSIFALASAATSSMRGVRVRRDPYAALICGLLDALQRLRSADEYRPSSGWVDWPAGPIWSPAHRNRVADRLDATAAIVAREFGAYPELRDFGHRVAAWLRGRRSEILIPSPVQPDNVEGELARGLVAVCRGDWAAVQQKPRLTSRRSRLRQAMPRIVTAGALVAAAALAPRALEGVIKPDTADTLQVTLALAAAGALIAPRDAFADAVKSIQSSLSKGHDS
jgi:hypothetical protein